MFQKKDYLILAIVCFIMGYFLVHQFYLHKKVVNVTQPETGESMALEVTELIKTNAKLRKEITKLEENVTKFSKAAADKKQADEALQENWEKYCIILGLTEISGPGVEIVFEEKIASTQLIDLINAIKNIGAEAIAINDKRMILTTPLEASIFFPPTKIEVIGKSELLKESLIRSGGIMGQIGLGTVIQKENLILPSI